MTAHMDNRQATIRYLMQMADEMKKMAQSVFVPSLALLFDMASDEARNFLEDKISSENKADIGKTDAGNMDKSNKAAAQTITGIAERTRTSMRGKTASIRQGRNHAAIMANKAPRKLKLHQSEIKA